ncbi:MAG TPA: type II secretion system F family protein [Candidatus Paceibacterota bacterium]
MKYKYQAKNKEGETQVGYVDAGNRDTAISVLSSHGLFILKIEESEKPGFLDRFSVYFSGIKRQDMVVFSRQFATLLQARLPLKNTLSTLFEQTTNPSLKNSIAMISQDIDAGLALSQAMERQPDIFSGFFVSMIRSAEVTGNLDQVAEFLADYNEREANLISKARSAMIYPLVIMVLFVVVAIIMMTVVFPQIRPIFEQSGAELPLLSKIFLNSGQIMSDWWFVFALGLVILVVMGAEYFQSPEGKTFIGDMKIKAPIIKKVYIPITITRFANASSMLLQGGIPVAQAMEIVGETIDNALYREVLHEISNDIRQGISLSQALSQRPEYFPSLVSQMVAVGETSGQLNQMFRKISDFYTREADTMVGNLVELIQPVLLVCVAIFVGLLFGSILLPLYSLTSTFQ